ncbi:MAG: 50S ribosomal protein L23 [Methanosarcinales archaeon]|nr:MAG: 50S ribosomal protein L23 [Methanosarcinales archaeon]
MAIKYPFITEKATIQLEEENKLQLIVDINATKNHIRTEVEDIYGFEVARVRTMITPTGKKKAILAFTDGNAASEIATRIGLF